LSAALQLSPLAFDSCNGIRYIKSSNPFQPTGCFNAGSYTNQWIAIDSCNNVSTPFTQIITILPPPPAVFPPVNDTTINCSDAPPTGRLLSFSNGNSGPCGR
jgi:hypothetical protein